MIRKKVVIFYQFIIFNPFFTVNAKINAVEKKENWQV
jgi:hypothetical protein